MPVSIQDVYLQFNPRQPLEEGDPRYVDCITERGLPALFQLLRLPLSDVEYPVPLFFTGHIGDGKTTLLKQLQGQLRREDKVFVAFGEADARLDVNDVAYDDILLTILGVVDAALRAEFNEDMEASVFRQIWDALVRIAALPVELRDFQASLGPFVTLIGAIKDAQDVRLQIRQRLRLANSPTFMQVVNEYLQRADAVVQRRGFRQLAVILDNLDRIPEKRDDANTYIDERLFLENIAHFQALACHVIYTIRLGLVNIQGPNLANVYGQVPISVPMVPVSLPDGSPHASGRLRLRDIVVNRLRAAGTTPEEAFDQPETVDRLCYLSGGHLRELMTFVQQTCTWALSRHPELPITADDMAVAINILRLQKRNAAINYREALDHVAQTHRLDDLKPDTRHALITQHLVFEYYIHGDYWYDLSPLLKENGE